MAIVMNRKAVETGDLFIDDELLHLLVLDVALPVSQTTEKQPRMGLPAGFLDILRDIAQADARFIVDNFT